MPALHGPAARPWGRRAVGAAALLLVGCLEPTSGPAPPPDLAALMRRARIPGLVAAEIEDGAVTRTLHLGVVSSATGEPVGPDTLFEAASLTKPLLATIALRLAERGELDFDRPLHELLVLERAAHDPRSEKLTARLVLSHQTGLPNWGPPERLEFGGDPGERFGYSGEGYVYLQRVVESVTGRGLEELAREEIFEPLGMERSRLSLPADDPSARAARHDRGGTPQPSDPSAEANAAYSLLTTAEDYARFMIAWMGGDLLRPESRAEALAPAVHLGRRSGAAGEAPALYADKAWGLGWGLELADAVERGPIAWHWGDNGQAQAFAAFRPRERSGLVYFANSQNGLAIARSLVEPILAPSAGQLAELFDWLGYESVEAPGFDQRLEGSVAEAEGRLSDALTAFRAALREAPDDEATARRIGWLEELLRVADDPVTVPPDKLAAWAGRYGPRVLRLEGGELHYQRDQRPGYRLIPLSETLFALDGMVDFRLEVALDSAGDPRALVGHYVEGGSDESPRDAKQGAP